MDNSEKLSLFKKGRSGSHGLTDISLSNGLSSMMSIHDKLFEPLEKNDVGPDFSMSSYVTTYSRTTYGFNPPRTDYWHMSDSGGVKVTLEQNPGGAI